MKTSIKQTSLFGEEELTSSRAASHVSHSLSPEKEKAQKMIAISGHECLRSLKMFNRPGLWAKTFLELLVGMGAWYSSRSALTWKLRGTKYNRLYFQLLPSTLPTEEAGCGLLQEGLLLTPTASEAVQDINQFQERMKKYPNGTKMPNLATQIQGLLPTPASRDYKGARTEESLEAAGRNKTNNLPDAFSQSGTTSQLNPLFVGEMMGYPDNWTLLPFLNGETNQ